MVSLPAEDWCIVFGWAEVTPYNTLFWPDLILERQQKIKK